MLGNKEGCRTMNEGISFPHKVATLARDKELGDNSCAKNILCLLNKVTIMETKLNIVWYPA